MLDGCFLLAANHRERCGAAIANPLRCIYPLLCMLEIRETTTFARWFSRLRDRRAQQIIDARIARLAAGNPGDVRPVGEGVSELRISYGPGYRVYYVPQGQNLIILLAGGDKDRQNSDIALARRLARALPT